MNQTSINMSPVTSKRKHTHKITPYLWLLPAFFLFFLFTFYPFIATIFKSFFIVNFFGELVRFVGFENYRYIFNDRLFVQALKNTLLFVLMTVPASKIFGFLLAMLANKRRKASAFYEASFALPMALASSVVAMIFQLLYVPSLGVINGLLGVEIQWLNDPRIALLSLAIIQIWLSTGYAFMFLLAAVRNVPTELLESADMDGASTFKKMIHIYLPLTTPIMFYLILTDIAFVMMMMSLMNILTEGGPFDSTMTLLLYVYRQMAVTGNYTNANPAAVIAFTMTFIATMLGFLWEKKGVHYQ